MRAALATLVAGAWALSSPQAQASAGGDKVDALRQQGFSPDAAATQQAKEAAQHAAETGPHETGVAAAAAESAGGAAGSKKEDSKKGKGKDKKKEKPKLKVRLVPNDF